jgi:hypothetical protein
MFFVFVGFARWMLRYLGGTMQTEAELDARASSFLFSENIKLKITGSPVASPLYRRGKTQNLQGYGGG